MTFIATVLTRRLALLAALLVLAAAPAQIAVAAPIDGGRVHIVSFGLWGSQSVFASEARGAAAVIATRFGKPATVTVKANTKRAAPVSEQSLGAALASLSGRIDPDKDVLFLVLTSHGTSDGIAFESQGRVRLMPPRRLAPLIESSGARYRVVIVSACYSGSFTSLADANTLVITAASATRSSFGCKDGNRWTYFGEAFFDQALRRETSLPAAFEAARRIIARREAADGFTPSEPQIAGGAEVLRRLGSP